MWQAAIQALQNIAQALSSILTRLNSMPSSAPSYQFAALPAAAGMAGSIVYVSNARKPGEGPGAGTGLTAFSDGAAWYGTNGTILTV